MLDIQKWQHVFKLDPAKFLSESSLQAVCTSQTDAIIIGGTLGVTYENTAELMARVRKYALPCVQELSSLDAVVPGFDLYFIPFVLNAYHPEWVLSTHLEALKKYGALIAWDQVVMEAYVIGNEQASAAQVTKSRTDLSLADVEAYARMTEHMLRFPVCYIEFSGRFGNPCWLQTAKKVLKQTRLFYGGGIYTSDQALQMSQWADTIVVGNAIYDDLPSALATASAIHQGR